MKTVHEFTEMEWERFTELLEKAYNLIDWDSIRRVINIYDSDGPFDEFWEVYPEAVTPIVDPSTALMEAGIEVGEVENQMFTDMADNIEQNPDNELKYWSHCQDCHWDLFRRILDIISDEGY